MKSYYNNSSKKSNKSGNAKTVALITAIVLIFVILGGLLGAVVTGTKPQDWFKKDTPPQTEVVSTPITTGDIMTFGTGEEGSPMYINLDTDVLDDVADKAATGLSIFDEGVYCVMGITPNSYNGTGHVTDDNNLLDILIGDFSEVSDEEKEVYGVTSSGLCIVMLYWPDEQTFSIFVLYDCETKTFGDIVGKDGQIIVPNSDFDFEVIAADNEYEDLDYGFVDYELFNKVFSATPFVEK